ncbi:MAG TPA: SDR family oxidoreductase [Chromatiales bacterium]|nr:SDR family oxidoreductase [Chromatiales bacterium]
MKNILILGATSAIAQHVARRYATRGDRLFLIGRNESALKVLQDDLRLRGAGQVETLTADLTEMARHADIIGTVRDRMDGIDVALIAYGTLGNQKEGEQDFAAALAELKVNFLSVLSLLTVLANTFEHQQSGTLAVISSVAGDRGRQSNYLYGTAKGGLTIFLQGLRNRLYRQGVHVLTIKPGFVDTPMTRDFDKGWLWVAPERIARGIVRAIDRRRDVVYLPWFWRLIMLVIRLIPEAVFKRLRL